MSEWFQRQFGDQGEFAMGVSLGDDPYPSGDEDRDLSWGSLEVWIRGRCLTASVCSGSVSQGVRWSTLPVLEWLLEVGIRLVNEDPYPRFSKGTDVGDGAGWYNATLSPPMLSADEERRWFLRRSEWRHHHALRRAAEDVALPNVVFKRLGDHVEVSWDNEAWGAPRRDLQFVEKRGRDLVSAAAFGSVVREALVEVLAELAKKGSSERLRTLASRAAGFEASAEDWRWLVHRPTAEIIRDQMSQLCARLDQATRLSADGLYVPHTPETRVLRHVRLDRRVDIEAVLRAAALLPDRPMAATLQALVRPRPAASVSPWDEANEYAERVRDALGWGVDPLPDLATWMPAQHVLIPSDDLGLPAAVALFSERTEEARAMVHVNPRASRMRRETGLATALGHILLDDQPVSVDGDWEHWPTSARARAFGVALTLPEDGVRDLLRGTSSIGADEVRAVMHAYRAGPWSTTYRLKNLGLITRDEQPELALAVS
jgi:Zn-dependent peptidase ImmA (M78 family)